MIITRAEKSTVQPLLPSVRTPKSHAFNYTRPPHCVLLRVALSNRIKFISMQFRNLISHFYSFSFSFYTRKSLRELGGFGESLNYGINTICPHLLFYTRPECDPNSSEMEKQINIQKLHWLWLRHKHNTATHHTWPTLAKKRRAVQVTEMKNVRFGGEFFGQIEIAFCWENYGECEKLSSITRWIMNNMTAIIEYFAQQSCWYDDEFYVIWAKSWN